MWWGGSSRPLQQDTWQQQPGREGRREVLPQNWGEDWDWTELRAGVATPSSSPSACLAVRLDGNSQ